MRRTVHEKDSTGRCRDHLRNGISACARLIE
jgi:hypothetical protein